MKHGQIDYKVGWIAAGVAAAGMVFLAADITIKHSSSPVSSRATGSTNTVASAQSAGAQVTQSERKVEKEHPPETQ